MIFSIIQFGCAIGYCVFIICKSLWTKKNRKMIILYVLPIIVTVSVFLGIYIIYINQELGNLPFEYNYKINMKNIDIESKINFSDDISKQNIYYTKILKEDETKEIAKKLFENLSADIDERRTNIYEDEAIYYSNAYHSIWVYYKGGTYNYTNFEIYSQKSFNETCTDEDNLYNEGVAIETANSDLKIKGASKEEIENALQKLGIEIPENAEFEEVTDGEYVFSINMEIQGNSLVDGKISLSYYKNEIISNLQNNLIKYDIINQKEIISEAQAYQEILEGKFQYNIYNIEKLESIVIENVQLQYAIDSKGYYVPTYVFGVKMNGDEGIIQIKAVK